MLCGRCTRASPATRTPPLPPAYSACPLPLPEGALNYFKTYHSTHLLCVRPPPTADFLLPLLGLPSARKPS